MSGACLLISGDYLEEKQKLKHEVIASRHTVVSLDDRLVELWVFGVIEHREKEYWALRERNDELEDMKAQGKALYVRERLTAERNDNQRRQEDLSAETGDPAL